MNVGYIDAEEAIVCSACWPRRLESGARPLQLLDSDDDVDPENNFWIVDNCAKCDREVKYRSIRTLD